MNHLSTYKVFEKKSKRKIGWFAKWCHNLGYSGVKNGKCSGKKKKHVRNMDFSKDYFYNMEDGKCVIPKMESISDLTKDEIESDVVNDLETICYDITDDGRLSIGFGSRARKRRYDPQDIQFEPERTYFIYIGVKDPMDHDGFHIQDVKDTLIRIKEYLGKRYQGCSVLEGGVVDRVSIGLTDYHLNMYIGYPLQNIYIEYYLSETWENGPTPRNESVMDEANTHIQTLKDILLDLKDDGYFVSVNPTPIAMATGVEPDIYVKMDELSDVTVVGFNSEVHIYPPFYDYYTRMISYMVSVGWDHKIIRTSIGHMEIRFFRK